MAASTPVLMRPVTFPARFAWLQQRIQTHVRPYHLAIGTGVVLITVVFGALVGVLILISTNFNLLGAVE